MSKAFVRESEVDEDEELVEVQSFPGFKNYMTPAGHRALREEFERLVKVERPQLVETVAWAASNGDRSENGDYLYGKRRLREIDRRIRFLNKRIESAEVVDPDSRPPTDQIFFGATVLYCDQKGEEHKIRIVGIDEADANHGDVSWISPIARVFLKAREGDEVKLPTPATVTHPAGVETLEILEVTYTSRQPR